MSIFLASLFEIYYMSHSQSKEDQNLILGIWATFCTKNPHYCIYEQIPLRPHTTPKCCERVIVNYVSTNCVTLPAEYILRLIMEY